MEGTDLSVNQQTTKEKDETCQVFTSLNHHCELGLPGDEHRVGRWSFKVEVRPCGRGIDGGRISGGRGSQLGGERQVQ